MSDNVVYQSGTPATPPAATIVAADVIKNADGDDITYQRVKIAIGKDGEVEGDATRDTSLPGTDWRAYELLTQILTTLKKIEHHLMLATDNELKDQDV